MKVKVINLDHRGFHSKLSHKTCNSILMAGHAITFGGESDLTHFVRVTDLTKVLRCGDSLISFLMMGLSNVYRYPEQLDAFKRALDSPRVYKIIVMSISPRSLREYVNVILGGIPDKLVITDEPPYEPQWFYRDVDVPPPSSPTVLYFGTYFYSKGADLLLDAASLLPDITFNMVGDTKLTSFDYDIQSRYSSLHNVSWRTGWVSETDARHAFLSCNLVVLPYRHYYTHDTSGVLNQAMLAQRPVLAPSIHPFVDVWQDYDVGDLFACESPRSLISHIRVFFDGPMRFNPDPYLDSQRGWEVIGASL